MQKNENRNLNPYRCKILTHVHDYESPQQPNSTQAIVSISSYFLKIMCKLLTVLDIQRNVINYIWLFDEGTNEEQDRPDQVPAVLVHMSQVTYLLQRVVFLANHQSFNLHMSKTWKTCIMFTYHICMLWRIAASSCDKLNHSKLHVLNHSKFNLWYLALVF